MALKKLIIIALIFYSSLTHATPNPLNLDLRKATAKDVKRMYKIEREDYWRDLIEYYLDLSSVPDNKLKKARVTCIPDSDILEVSLSYDREEFDNIVSDLSNKYGLPERAPVVDRSLDVELFAVFKHDDFTIIVDAPIDDYELRLIYYSPKFSNRNYKLR